MAQADGPCLDGYADLSIGLFEGRPVPAERVPYFLLVLPLAEQEDLAARFGGDPVDAVDMPALHDQHQLGLSQHGDVQLAGPVFERPVPVFEEYGAGGGFHGQADLGRQTGGIDLQVPIAA